MKAKKIIPLINSQARSILKGMLNELNYNISDKMWHEFETRFEYVHEGFFDNLHKHFPDLTPTELKTCSFLRLNMTTKDIACLTNRSKGTIDNIRYNIRKKNEY